jgi:hypothetical protein
MMAEARSWRTGSPAGGRGGRGGGGVESGAMRRLSRLAMCVAGRGGNATLDGGVDGGEMGSTRLGRIVERGVRAGCGFDRTVQRPGVWTPTLGA